MTHYTKQRVTMQYTEIQYLWDGEIIATEVLNDDHSYGAEPAEPMSEEEIEDWA